MWLLKHRFYCRLYFTWGWDRHFWYGRYKHFLSVVQLVKG